MTVETTHVRKNKMIGHIPTLWPFQCVKSVRIWSFSGLYFPAFGLNTEKYGVSLSANISPNAGKYGPKKLWTRALFTQCLFWRFFCDDINKNYFSTLNQIKLNALWVYDSLKLMSHGILHYLWATDLLRNNLNYYVYIYLFSFFFNRFCRVGNCGVISLTLTHHIETSQLIYIENQLTGLYMMKTLVVNGVRNKNRV